MITNAVYLDNNNNEYNKDYIVSFNIPILYQVEKKIIIFVHNTVELAQSKICNYIFEQKLNLLNYQVIYTSNFLKMNYNFMQIPYNSTYDLNQLNDYIKVICKDTHLYTVFLITDQSSYHYRDESIFNVNVIHCKLNINLFDIYINNILYHETDALYLYINNIAQEKIINIKDSNFTSLINYKYKINTHNQIILLVDDCKINFNNYIIIEVYGFTHYFTKIKLNYSNMHNYKDQLVAIQNRLLDLYNNIKDFTIIQKKFLHSINYYKKYHSNNVIYYDIIQSATLSYNNLQSLYLKIQVAITKDSNIADKLFEKSLIMTPNNIKNKSYNIYNKQRIRASIINNIIPTIEISDLNNVNFNKSLSFYTSLLSLSNWKDEMENNSCLGLLINVNSTFSDIMGYSSNYINVKNIATTLISPEQIYDGQNFYWNKHNLLDNGKNELDNIIIGSGIGRGNAIIPLYINKYHWQTAEYKLEENLSIALTQNPYSFKPIMLDLYSHVLISFINIIIKENQSDINIKYLIAIIVTMIKLQLNLDLDYKYFMEEYYNPIKIMQIHNIRVTLATFIINYVINPLDNKVTELFFIRIYEEIIRINMKNKDLSKIVDNKRNINCNKILKFLNYNTNKENITELKSIQKFIACIDKQDFNILIQKYDTNYGWLEDIDILDLKNSIKNNVNNQIDFLNLDNKEDIIKCLFTVQTYLCRNNKNKLQSINKLRYIDIFQDISLVNIQDSFENLVYKIL